MAESCPPLKPKQLGNAEFLRSNVFVAWSRKLGRRICLIGPSQFDAWSVGEFDPGIDWSCERPPIEPVLLPLQVRASPIAARGKVM